MALSDYTTVQITQNSAGPTLPGFGVPMHVSYTATWAERTRVYSNLAAVAVDFQQTTGPEYLTAQAIFSQNPAPPQMMIGRGANKPTQSYQLSAISPTTNASYTYQYNVRGTGVTPTLVSFTSDSSPTDAEWASAAVQAFNAVASKNFTASGSASPITITANTAGAWFSIEVVNPNDSKVTENQVDPGIVADLTAITAENPNWYGLCSAFNSKPLAIAAAGYCESNGRIFVASSNDTTTILTTTGNGDLLDQIKTNSYANTLGFYHPVKSAFADAALLGKCLPFNPGSETWKFKTLAGVPTFPMTAAQRTNITARNGNSYESVAGLSITFDGKVGSGNFLDVTRGLHWLTSTIQTMVFSALAGAAKVPYTDAGIAVIQSQVLGALKIATDRGVLTTDVPFTVTVPTNAMVTAADKVSRTLNNVFFTGKLAGAVHSANIQGTVTA